MGFTGSHTEDTKRQISESLTGITRSKETRARMAASHLFDRETQPREWERERGLKLLQLIALERVEAEYRA